MKSCEKKEVRYIKEFMHDASHHKPFPLIDSLIAVLITLSWGGNFVAIQIGLEGVSPLLLCTARFLLTSIPAVFFIKRPRAPIGKVAAYGLVLFALQFALLFMGMKAGVPAGLAFVLMQAQVFFSILVGMLFSEKKPILGRSPERSSPFWGSDSSDITWAARSRSPDLSWFLLQLFPGVSGMGLPSGSAK